MGDLNFLQEVQATTKGIPTYLICQEPEPETSIAASSNDVITICKLLRNGGTF